MAVLGVVAQAQGTESGHATIDALVKQAKEYWQAGEEVVYMLVFEGDLTEGENPEEHACQMLPSRLSEALPIPVLQEWAETLWKAGTKQDLIAELSTGGDNPLGFSVQIIESVWADILTKLLMEGKIMIPECH